MTSPAAALVVQQVRGRVGTETRHTGGLTASNIILMDFLLYYTMEVTQRSGDSRGHELHTHT